MKEIQRPSGDQRGSLCSTSSVSSMVASPVATSSTPRLLKPFRSETKARRVPSGDQRGSVSRQSKVLGVSARASPPAAAMSQMSWLLWASSRGRVLRVKANMAPSADSWPLPPGPTRSISPVSTSTEATELSQYMLVLK